jgi:hypothetical protein
MMALETGKLETKNYYAEVEVYGSQRNSPARVDQVLRRFQQAT